MSLVQSSHPQSEIKMKQKKEISFLPGMFLFFFNLRQGTILIAVLNIALSACAFILLLVAIAHAQEMMEVLNADMEDNAEREGTILIDGEDLSLVRDFSEEPTNNQQKFKVAQNLAMMMVVFLYGSLGATGIYLFFCTALFYGAAKNKRQYVKPWIFPASLLMVILIFGLCAGDGNATLIKLFGGHFLYVLWCILLVFCHIYCIVTVWSFAYELKMWQKKLTGISDSKLKLKIARIEKLAGVTIRFNPVVAEARLV